MKKLLLSSFVACTMMLLSLTMSAQKKTTPIQLTNEADTVSYALGVTMVQSGLKSYLQQMGVVADTLTISDSYQSKIANETDEKKKSTLNKELAFKLDSVKKANSKNINEFLNGFTSSFIKDDSKAAFNSGIAIGTQLSSVTDKFSEEVLGEEGSFNMEVFAAAFADALKEDKLLLENTEELIQDASMKAAKMKEEKQAEEMKAEYATQIAEGDRFLAENKTKDGVVTLPSGLQYKILTKGSGEIPTATDRVKVHYKGTLLDGTVFDSSIDRGEPIVLGVTNVIKGWAEALLLMPVGSKWELYIPYDLGYGGRDQGTIKPFSVLVFEVELLDIEK